MMKHIPKNNIFVLLILIFCVLVLFHQSAPTNYKVLLNHPKNVDKVKVGWKATKRTKQPPIPTAKGPRNYSDIEKDVFVPFGYEIEKDTFIPTLNWIQQPSCQKVFVDWIAKQKGNDESRVPPTDLPAELVHEFSQFGHTVMDKSYCDNHSGSKHVTWSNIDELMKQDPNTFKKYSDGMGAYTAMQAHRLDGKTGFVVGSLHPWIEVFALKSGAKKVVTIEYMNITIVNTDKISYLHPVDVAKTWEQHVDKYDFAVSFSSIEHSGLGRFGDVLDPIGDFREMQKVHCMLKQGGLFFFGVPTGKDALHFNIHRVYGRIRLAMMFTGFEIIEAFYKEEPPFQIDISKIDLMVGEPQYVFVLRKL